MWRFCVEIRVWIKLLLGSGVNLSHCLVVSDGGRKVENPRILNVDETGPVAAGCHRADFARFACCSYLALL